MIPVGLTGVRVAGPPKATMALAGAALLLSVLLWLAPDAHRDNVLADIRGFGKAHPTEIPPEDCSVPMGMGPWLTQGAKPASAEYESLCGELRQSELRTGSLRVSLGYEHNGPLDWLLHPLVFANPVLALLGCALLFLGVGPYLEDRWGRRTYLAVIAVAALGSALVRNLVCNSGSLPWTGAQGWLGALVAAFTVVFLTAQVQFVAPTWPPRTLTLPAWSVAAWWLMVRLIAMWWTGADRASVIGELAGWAIGGAAGLAVHLGWLGQLQAVAAPQLDAGWAKLRRLAQKDESGSRGKPPPGEDQDAASDTAEPEPEEEEPVYGERDLFALEPEPPALVIQRRPPRQLELPVDPDAPASQPHEAPRPAELLAESVPAAEPWAQQPTPTPNNLSWLLGNKPKPAEPPLPDFGALAAPPRVETAQNDDLLAALNPVIARPAPPPPVEEDTVMVLDRPPITGPKPRPPSELTVAYLPRDAVRTAISEALHRGVVAAQVVTADDLGRDAQGVLHAQCGGAWQSLNPVGVKAIAAGIVIHRDDPSAAPQVYIDCILALGDRDVPARAIRLCANAAMLQRLAPGQDGTKAFASLALELASGGAKRLPESATWPGPPWPRYDTLADFMRMWQKAG